jgi:hypothetical protein
MVGLSSTALAEAAGNIRPFPNRVHRDGPYWKPMFWQKPLIPMRHTLSENKLQRIHIGDPVKVRLMGSQSALQGKVQSIAAGIEDRDRSNGLTLLANVNPTFSWVRLAQRVPVRIALDRTVERNELVAGVTATVEVLESDSKDGRS